MSEIDNGDKALKRGRGRPKVYELYVNVRFTRPERDAINAWIAATMAGATYQQAIREAVRLVVAPRPPLFNLEHGNCVADAEVAFAAAAKSEEQHFHDAQRELQAIENALPADHSTQDTIRSILDAPERRLAIKP